MPIEFSCEQCGRLVQAGDGTSGRRVLCPGCGAFSTVPPSQGGPADDRPTPEHQREPPPPPAADPSSPFAAQPVDPADAENPYLAPTEYGPPPPFQPYGGPTGQTDPKAVISLVLGISGFLLFCCCAPMSAPIGLTGLILGVMARKSDSRGMAIAGMILCGIQLALALAYVLFFVVMMVIGNVQGSGPPLGF